MRSAFPALIVVVPPTHLPLTSAIPSLLRVILMGGNRKPVRRSSKSIPLAFIRSMTGMLILKG